MPAQHKLKLKLMPARRVKIKMISTFKYMMTAGYPVQYRWIFADRNLSNRLTSESAQNTKKMYGKKLAYS